MRACVHVCVRACVRACSAQPLFNTEAELVGSRKQMRDQSLIPDLKYADDMCPLSSSRDELEEILLGLNQSCNEMGLSISAHKTKILVGTSVQQEAPRSVTLQNADEPVDVVEELENLGSIVTSVCGLDREINVRIRKASNSFRRLCKILWYQKSIKQSTKPRMLKVAIMPTLSYGSETWTPLSQHLKRLQSFVTHCLRIILGVSVREKQRNTTVRTMARIETVVNHDQEEKATMARSCSHGET